MNERLLVLVRYFLSGACGLVYEIVWMRRLSLTFGITVFATSTVLAVLMAGLGLGIGLYVLAVPWLKELRALYARLREPVAPLLVAESAARGDGVRGR